MVEGTSSTKSVIYHAKVSHELLYDSPYFLNSCYRIEIDPGHYIICKRMKTVFVCANDQL
jgi:hypothetical protein